MTCFCWRRSLQPAGALGISPSVTLWGTWLRASLDARDALLWNLTVVGEASGQLSTALRDAHPEVPWSQPIRSRNRIVHGYWSVDLDVLHSVAVHDLPGFEAEVSAIAERLAETS